jgi:hypothetical protein
VGLAKNLAQREPASGGGERRGGAIPPMTTEERTWRIGSLVPDFAFALGLQRRP